MNVPIWACVAVPVLVAVITLLIGYAWGYTDADRRWR